MHAKHADDLGEFDRPPTTRSIATRGLLKSTQEELSPCRFEIIGAWHLRTRSQEPFQKFVPARIQHRGPAADYQPRPIIQPDRICVLCVHHLAFALNFSFLLPLADGCGHVGVPTAY